MLHLVHVILQFSADAFRTLALVTFLMLKHGIQNFSSLMHFVNVDYLGDISKLFC